MSDATAVDVDAILLDAIRTTRDAGDQRWAPIGAVVETAVQHDALTFETVLEGLAYLYRHGEVYLPTQTTISVTRDPLAADGEIEHARTCAGCGAETFQYERCHQCGDVPWTDDDSELVTDGGEGLPDFEAIDGDGASNEWPGPHCAECDRPVDTTSAVKVPVHVEHDDDPGYERIPMWHCRRCATRKIGFECDECGERWLHEDIARKCCTEYPGGNSPRVRPDGGRVVEYHCADCGPVLECDVDDVGNRRCRECGTVVETVATDGGSEGGESPEKSQYSCFEHRVRALVTYDGQGPVLMFTDWWDRPDYPIRVAKKLRAEGYSVCIESRARMQTEDFEEVPE